MVDLQGKTEVPYEKAHCIGQVCYAGDWVQTGIEAIQDDRLEEGSYGWFVGIVGDEIVWAGGAVVGAGKACHRWKTYWGCMVLVVCLMAFLTGTVYCPCSRRVVDTMYGSSKLMKLC